MKKWYVVLLCIILVISASMPGIAEEYLAMPGFSDVMVIARGVHEDTFQTPHFELHYSDAYTETLVVSVDGIEDGTIITASAKLSEKKVTLYTVAMCEEEIMDGTVLGTLNYGPEKQIMILLQMNEIDPTDWTEEEYTNICQLMETVNVFVKQFADDPLFVTAN